MTETTTLRSLPDRLEDHAGCWDSDLDREIALAIGWDQDAAGEWHAVGKFFSDNKLRRTSYAVDLPAYTRSLDAAMSLLPPEGFPLWTFRLDVRSHGSHGMRYQAMVTVPTREAQGISRNNSALAICAAALRAKEFFKYG